MAPFEAWLLMRSLRTLPIRMKKHQENSRRVAHCLEEHPAVAKVFYPGAPSFEQRRLADKQLTGFSGLMSFELTTKSQKDVEAFVDGLEFFQIGVSWGGHESLVFPPGLAYEKELPPDQFEAMGISRSLIRISVGLEDAEDLVADLEKSLSRL